MILALLFIAACATCGTYALTAAKVSTKRSELIALGTTCGITFGGAVTYVATRLAGNTQPVLIGELTVLVLLAGYLGKKFGSAWRKTKWDRATLLVLILSLVFSASLVPKVLIRQEDGLFTGVYHAYGDIGWHIATITSLRDNPDWIPSNPSFAGQPLVYPFMPSFLSAILLRLGADYPAALALPATLMLAALLTLLFSYSYRVSSDKRAAAIALILFVGFGATVGAVHAVQDFQTADQSVWQFLATLQDNYSGSSTHPEQLLLPNIIYALLLPQRSLMFGMAMVLSIALLLTQKAATAQRAYLIAGATTGLLPFFHAHSVIALLALIITLCTVRPRAPWGLFAISAALTGIPAVLYYTGTIHQSSSFLRWSPGWLIEDSNIFIFWIKNSGFILPATVLGFFLKPKRLLWATALAGLCLYVIANMFAFAPWLWDNTKIFVYWVLLTTPMLGYVAARAWKKHIVLQSIAIALILAHIASGSLDLIQVALSTRGPWIEWDTQSIYAANQINQHTGSHESIIAYPTWNSPVALAGRSAYLGYPAHVWSHGSTPWQREQATKQLFEGGIESLPETTPDYILIGPQERNGYNNIFIRPTWKPVFSNEQYTLYSLDK